MVRVGANNDKTNVFDNTTDMESEVSYMGKGNANDMSVTNDKPLVFDQTIDMGSDFSNNKNESKVMVDSD
jgi:hypothetical protein